MDSITQLMTLADVYHAGLDTDSFSAAAAITAERDQAGAALVGVDRI